MTHKRRKTDVRKAISHNSRFSITNEACFDVSLVVVSANRSHSEVMLASASGREGEKIFDGTRPRLARLSNNGILIHNPHCKQNVDKDISNSIKFRKLCVSWRQ